MKTIDIFLMFLGVAITIYSIALAFKGRIFFAAFGFLCAFILIYPNYIAITKPQENMHIQIIEDKDNVQEVGKNVTVTTVDAGEKTTVLDKSFFLNIDIIYLILFPILLSVILALFLFINRFIQIYKRKNDL